MLSEIITSQIKQLLGDRFTVNPGVREVHGRDESFHTPAAPEAVVFPQTTEEVREIVCLANAHRVPLIPFGVGTSLEGHVAALHGGICVDVSGMNHILEINTRDMDVRVEAGVTRKQLNQNLRSDGLFFPVDPGADATLGGMAATRASGTNAVRYGTMSDNVLGLTVVTGTGEVIHTGSRARKSAAGYDLTSLLCGSEGTLGIITEVQLRCYGLPEAHSTGVCAFSSLKGAVEAVITIIQMGIPVARVELLDEVQVRAINQYSKLDHAEAPTLFFEFHGSAAGVVEQSEVVAGIVREFGGGEFRWSTLQEEQNALWQARHDAYYASMALRPGCSGWPTDVCVPISRLAECILATRADVETTGLLAPIVGHVGDGNFHVLLLVDTSNEEELGTARAFNDRLVKRALGMGGTCTGEHGIGYGKLPYMVMEHGNAISVMRVIKQALDPLNIMNPGKVIPAESGSGPASRPPAKSCP